MSPLLVRCSNNVPGFSYGGTIHMFVGGFTSVTPATLPGHGAAESWYIDFGTLPNGVTLSTTTGTISGTPTQAVASGLIVCAVNFGGSACAQAVVSVTGTSVVL